MGGQRITHQDVMGRRTRFVAQTKVIFQRLTSLGRVHDSGAERNYRRRGIRGTRSPRRKRQFRGGYQSFCRRLIRQGWPGRSRRSDLGGAKRRRSRFGLRPAKTGKQNQAQNGDQRRQDQSESASAPSHHYLRRRRRKVESNRFFSHPSFFRFACQPQLRFDKAWISFANLRSRHTPPFRHLGVSLTGLAASPRLPPNPPLPGLEVFDPCSSFGSVMELRDR